MFPPDDGMGPKMTSYGTYGNKEPPPRPPPSYTEKAADPRPISTNPFVGNGAPPYGNMAPPYQGMADPSIFQTKEELVQVEARDRYLNGDIRDRDI